MNFDCLHFFQHSAMSFCYNQKLLLEQENGTWRSLVARLLWEQDVAGSNPVVPTMRVWFNGRTSAFQADNAGSIPVTRSIREHSPVRRAFSLPKPLPFLCCRLTAQYKPYPVNAKSGAEAPLSSLHPVTLHRRKAQSTQSGRYRKISLMPRPLTISSMASLSSFAAAEVSRARSTLFFTPFLTSP